MDFSELKNINLTNIGTSPLWVKVLMIGVACLAILFAGYYLHHKDQLEDLKRVQAKELELRTTFENKAEKASNLELYKVQLEEMRRTFGTLLRQLPSKTEIPALIVDISQTGLANGLEIELFKPQGESKKEFYAEKAIALRVKGDYHQFGAFASDIAALPRIVTLHNISLTPSDNKMTMTAEVKTYRYLDEDEE
ncbi:MAG: type 4a pilus biogenesis protein PilO [Gammaproteobacteria bacterium]|nr:type 4a pilus biogenesis protein PilO [Gammaproteobacteria bacterium]